LPVVIGALPLWRCTAIHPKVYALWALPYKATASARVAPQRCPTYAVLQVLAGSYYVSLLYEYEAVAVTREVFRILGLDFSMTELYVTSEGEHGEYPHYYRSSQEKLRRMQRSLSRMERGSQNYKKQRRKIARLHEHIANQRRDFQHNKARQIANEWDLVGIESLNMDGMKQVLHFGKSASDNGWGLLWKNSPISWQSRERNW